MLWRDCTSQRMVALRSHRCFLRSFEFRHSEFLLKIKRRRPPLNSQIHDDPSSSSPVVPLAALPACACRGAHRLCGPIGRVGYRRYTTSTPIHSLTLDCGAAGISAGVSRIRRTWPRRELAELVRHRPVVAYVAVGRSWYVHRAASRFR